MAKKLIHNEQNKTIGEKIDTLSEYVHELSAEERAQQDVANKIYETLKSIVDKKNEKAHLYQAEFNRRLEKRINDKGRKDLLQQHFWSSNPKEVITTMFKPGNEDKYKAYKEAEKKLEQEEYKNIFEVFKRAYNKNISMHKGSDIDKKAIHFLLKKSGFFQDKKGKEEFKSIIQEVPHGQSIDKWLTVDSWGTVHGIKVENIEKITPKGDILKTLIGSKAIVDEHGDGSPKSKTTNRPTSSTHIIHTILRSLNKISGKEKQQIQRFVDFIDIVDSLEYQASSIDYQNQHKTLFGLHHQLSIEEIYDYFKTPQNKGFEIISDEELKNKTIQKTFRKNWKKTKKKVSRKELSDEQEKNLKESNKELIKIEPKRWLSFNGHKFTVVYDDEVKYGPQAAAYRWSGVIKIGKDRDTNQPYLYIFNPFEEFTRSIGGIEPDGHFLHKKNITKETLQKVLNEFGYTNDYIYTKLPKKWVKKDAMKYIEEYTPLPELDIKKLKIGEIVTGVIKNSTKNMIHISLWKKISWVIKKTKDTKELKKWEKITVKIIDISKSADNEKIQIELEQVA